MRHLLLGVGVLTVVASAAIGAQGGSPLNVPTALRLPSTLPPCGISTVVTKLARTSRVAIGFEEGDCRGKFPRINVRYDETNSQNLTVRDVLDQLVTLSPDYRWSEMNGVAVIRPVASWSDPSNPLNLHVQPFQIEHPTIYQVLAVILQVPAPPHHGKIDNQDFAIAFKGGTIIDALNTLVLARGGVGWHAGLSIHPTSTPTLALSIWSFKAGDLADGEGAVGMGTPLQHLLASQ